MCIGFKLCSEHFQIDSGLVLDNFETLGRLVQAFAWPFETCPDVVHTVVGIVKTCVEVSHLC